jgi:hypothetical protein
VNEYHANVGTDLSHTTKRLSSLTRGLPESNIQVIEETIKTKQMEYFSGLRDFEYGNYELACRIIAKIFEDCVFDDHDI